MLASCVINTPLLDRVIREQVGSCGFKVIAHPIHSLLLGLDASSHGWLDYLQPSIVALDGVQQVANLAVFVGKLVCHTLSSSLHKCVSVLGNEPLEVQVLL